MRKYKYLFATLLAAICCSLTMSAKPVKHPDSYAYTRALEAIDQEKYDEAFGWLSREIRENPDNGYAYARISGIYYQLNEYGKALSALNEALKKLPKKDKESIANTYLNRCSVYLAMEDTVSGLHDVDAAIKLDPKRKDLYDARGMIYSEQGKYDLAEADYKKIIELDPGDVTGYIGVALADIDRHRYDEAIKLLDYAIKLSPELSMGYSNRALAYASKGMLPEAVNDIIKALKIDGDQQAFLLMYSLPAEATGLMESKLKIEATKDPTNLLWPYRLGILAESNADLDKAISYYEKANAIEPTPGLLERIAKCYDIKNDYVKALDYTEQALAMLPDDYDLIDLKATCLGRLGRYDECLAERDRYVAKYPESAAAYIERAEDLLNAGRYNQAIEDYNTAIVLVPTLAEHPFVLMKRGDAYRFSGKTAEAANDYNTLLAVEKDSTLSAESYTPFAYSGLGNAEKAIETMQYILDNDTSNVIGTLYNAACIYARLGQKSEAIRMLKQAIEKGYRDIWHIKADYDMNSLRDMPEYQQIISTFESKPSADSKSDRPAAAESLDDGGTAQIVEVPFTRENGVAKVKCSINGLPLHFVFDTGASNVTMSMVEANFMLKNDYIKPADIIGTSLYTDAEGEILEGTIVNLRKVDFGGLELENVRAAVIKNQKAPLLLGQSVLGRLGKIEIDNSGRQLKITHRARR